MNKSVVNAELMRVWKDVVGLAQPWKREKVQAVVAAHSKALADSFYDTMQANPAAAPMLHHEIVSQRLHASMMKWLERLFDTRLPVEENIAVQHKTGEVHARIGVPIHMVASGARVLKREIVRHLVAEHLPPERMAVAVQYVYELIDIAIDTMTASYDSNATRLTRSDESYRLQFLTQNLKTERERQKSQLMEWAHLLLVRNYWSVGHEDEAVEGRTDRRTSFELWLQHKASMLFEQSPQLAQIRERIADIDARLLPRLIQARSHPEEARQVVATLNKDVEEIKAMLGQMFDEVTQLEEGRDSVTHLLNRRYFPTVAKREIALAQAGGSVFAVLKVDIDRFETVGEALGMEASDAVLAQVAEVLGDSVRAGDFVFRVGDDQFLILVVEVAEAPAMSLADALRKRVAGLNLRTPQRAAPSLTVSVGVAMFDGHPDYQRLLDHADAALRLARQAGGNRVTLASPERTPL